MFSDVKFIIFFFSESARQECNFCNYGEKERQTDRDTKILCVISPELIV